MLGSRKQKTQRDCESEDFPSQGHVGLENIFSTVISNILTLSSVQRLKRGSLNFSLTLIHFKARREIPLSFYKWRRWGLNKMTNFPGLNSIGMPAFRSISSEHLFFSRFRGCAFCHVHLALNLTGSRRECPPACSGPWRAGRSCSPSRLLPPSQQAPCSAHMLLAPTSRVRQPSVERVP